MFTINNVGDLGVATLENLANVDTVMSLPINELGLPELIKRNVVDLMKLLLHVHPRIDGEILLLPSPTIASVQSLYSQPKVTMQKHPPEVSLVRIDEFLTNLPDVDVLVIHGTPEDEFEPCAEFYNDEIREVKVLQVNYSFFKRLTVKDRYLRRVTSLVMYLNTLLDEDSSSKFNKVVKYMPNIESLEIEYLSHKSNACKILNFKNSLKQLRLTCGYFSSNAEIIDMLKILENLQLFSLKMGLEKSILSLEEISHCCPNLRILHLFGLKNVTSNDVIGYMTTNIGENGEMLMRQHVLKEFLVTGVSSDTMEEVNRSTEITPEMKTRIVFSGTLGGYASSLARMIARHNFCKTSRQAFLSMLYYADVFRDVIEMEKFTEVCPSLLLVLSTLVLHGSTAYYLKGKQFRAIRSRLGSKEMIEKYQPNVLRSVLTALAYIINSEYGGSSEMAIDCSTLLVQLDEYKVIAPNLEKYLKAIVRLRIQVYFHETLSPRLLALERKYLDILANSTP